MQAAERIEQAIKQLEASNGDNIGALRSRLGVDELDIAEPEMALQTARLIQLELTEDFKNSRAWTPEMENVRAGLSQVDKVAGAVRAAKDSPLAILNPIIEAEPHLVDRLRFSAQLAARSVAACPHDYRASWGLFRADANVLSTHERARNFARLLLLTGHFPSLQEKIGTVALWSEADARIGLAFWRKYLRAHPQYSTRIVPLIGEQLSVSDLETVLPNDSLIRLAIANQLSRRPETQANGEALRSQVDYAAARSQASNLNDWLLLAWYAEKEERAELRLEALSEAARLGAPQSCLALSTGTFQILARRSSWGHPGPAGCRKKSTCQSHIPRPTQQVGRRDTWNSWGE